MRGVWAARVLSLLGAVACAAGDARALDITSPGNAPPSAWIVDFGGYGVLEPIYEGSKRYTLGFKPEIDVWKAGDKEWLSFPNDAIGYPLYETSNLRAGPAGHDLAAERRSRPGYRYPPWKGRGGSLRGAFAEYYPFTFVRTRAEVLQGITGNPGLASNLSADYIWKPRTDWTLTLGPRFQIANSEYASNYFAVQNAKMTGKYVPFKAEGGLLSSGAEMTGKYDWSKQVSTKVFFDINELVGDAADNPRATVKGTPEQFVLGIGGSYKFAVAP